MNVKLSTLIAASGISLFAGIASAQMPMQDTWDINAPNGTPLRIAAEPEAATHTGVHGHAASAAIAQRVIDVRPDTKSVNVRDGETVLFKVGSASFAWTFEPTLRHTSFGLGEIAPQGVDVRGVQVYCEPTPYERAG
jgi:hypothetical protein